MADSETNEPVEEAIPPAPADMTVPSDEEDDANPVDDYNQDDEEEEAVGGDVGGAAAAPSGGAAAASADTTDDTDDTDDTGGKSFSQKAKGALATAGKETLKAGQKLGVNAQPFLWRFGTDFSCILSTAF